MHEFSIAVSLVEQICDLAAENGLPVVDRVELEIGELRQVIPEVMQLAFRESARGTPAESAELVIQAIEARARCLRCSRSFRPTTWDYSCSDCGVSDVEVLAGDALILKSIEASEPIEAAKS